MRKADVKVGMLVTCKEPVRAYYSGYPKGHPVCVFESGDIGVVAETNVPYVVNREGTFACVDFYKSGNIHNLHHWQENGESPWRAGLDYPNLRKLTRQELEAHPYHCLTIELCEPCAEHKARIETEFPYQFADSKVSEAAPSHVVVRLLHPITLWQIYWLGIQKGKGTIKNWFSLENEMPRISS
jgi:hypothetical protein